MKMKYKSTVYDSQPEILKRRLGGELFTPITLDDTAFTNNICKAGNPITATGTIDNAGATAIGILLSDVTKDNPNGTLIRAFACVNTANCNKNAGITIAEEVKAALPLIVFD